MKKLIALLLAVLLAVTGTLALAEAVPTPPMTIANAITFDHDACKKIMADMGLDAEQIEVVESTLALIEASGQRLVVAEDGFEYTMILGGNTVATIAGDFTPEGVSIGSNLFPHYVLTVSNATIEDVIARFTAEAQAETVSEAVGLLPELIGLFWVYNSELTNVVKSAIVVGEAETGEYTVDGDTYNAMLPVSVDTRAIADGVVDLADKLIHSEPVVKLQAVLKSIDIELPLETPTIEDVPAISAKAYACQDESGKANGPVYVEVDAAGKEGASSLVQVQARVDGENVRVKVSVPGIASDAQYEQFRSDTGAFARLDVNVGQIYAGLSLEAVLGDESHFSFNVYYPDQSTPLVKDDIAVTTGGQRLYPVEGKNKTVLSLEGLLAGEEGAWLYLLGDVVRFSAVEIVSLSNQSQPALENLIGELRGQ